MRRRAHVQLHEEDLYYLLALKPGERVVTVWADPMRDSIMIGVEGDETTDLPETSPGVATSRIERPYALINLRDRMRTMVATMYRYTGPERDDYLKALGELVEKEIFPDLGVDVPPEPTVS